MKSESPFEKSSTNFVAAIFFWNIYLFIFDSKCSSLFSISSVLSLLYNRNKSNRLAIYNNLIFYCWLLWKVHSPQKHSCSHKFAHMTKGRWWTHTIYIWVYNCIEQANSMNHAVHCEYVCCVWIIKFIGVTSTHIKCTHKRIYYLRWVIHLLIRLSNECAVTWYTWCIHIDIDILYKTKSWMGTKQKSQENHFQDCKWIVFSQP